MAPMAMNFAVLQHSQPDVLNGHGLLDMNPADQALPLADSGQISFGKISQIILSTLACSKPPNSLSD